MNKWVVAAVLIIGVFLMSTNIRFGSSVEDDSVRESFSGKAALLNSPLEAGHLVHVSESKPTEIELPFKSPVNISGFSIFFPGNLHLVSSYLPREFKVYYKSTDDKWILLEEVTDNRNSVYKYLSRNNFPTKALRVDISRAAFDDAVQITDLRFYTRREIPLIDLISDFIRSRSRNFISYLILSLVLFLLILLPGYAFLIIANEKWRVAIPGEFRLVFAPAFSILLLGIVTILYLWTHGFYWFYLYLLLFYCSVWLLFKRRLYKQIISEAKWPLLVISLALLAVNTLQAKRDFLFNLDYIEPYLDRLEFVPIKGGYFGYHADNTLQWGIARQFLHLAPLFSETADKYRIEGDGNNVLDRTPLLPLVTAPILFFFGEGHFVYQRFLNVLMSLYYGASFLLLTKLFSRWTAKITSLLLLLSGHITFQVFNTEVYYKYFSIYPILLALLMWRDNSKRVSRYKLPFLGLLLAMAYFIHPMTLFFSGLLFVAVVLSRKSDGKLIPKLLIVFLPLMFTVLLWTGITYSAKQVISNGFPTRMGIYENQVLSLNDGSLKNIFYNAVNFFVPDILAKSGAYTNKISKDYLLGQFLRLSLIAAMTPLMFVWLIFSLFKSEVWRKYHFQLLYGLGTLALYLIVLRRYSFGHYSVFYPFVLLFLLGLSVERLRERGRLFRSLLLLSFPLFSLLYLRFLSGTFSALRYLSPTVRSLTYPILAIYIFGIFALAVMSLSNKKLT